MTSEQAAKCEERVVAYRTFDSVEANALAEKLAEAGVDAHVIGDFLDGGYPGLRLGGNAAVEVWVPARQRETAAPLLAAWAAKHHPASPEGDNTFQFSMKAVLVALTVTALYMGASAADPPVSDVALVTMELVLIVGAIAFLVRRWVREHSARESAEAAATPSNPFEDGI